MIRSQHQEITKLSNPYPGLFTNSGATPHMSNLTTPPQFDRIQHTDAKGHEFWVKPFLDLGTSTFTYVVSDTSGVCAVIDPVLGFDLHTGRTSTDQLDQIIDYVQTQKLKVEWILETHAHADHLSSAPRLQEALGGQIAISEKITEVQAIFKHKFDIADQFEGDHYFDVLLPIEQSFALGELEVMVMHAPGHTPADAAFLIGDAAFVGDTLFEPDLGTARCDFAGGSASELYASVGRLLSLPPETQVYVCHDYPKDREYRYVSSVAAHKARNIHVADGISEQEFVDMRTRRDKTLGLPSLLIPSVQMNIRAGKSGPSVTTDNPGGFVKVPIDLF